MPEVNNISDIPQYDPYNPQQRTVSSELGKDEFLRLFITRLQHQDPMSPSENGEFIAELAQFSSLEQMTNINETLASGMGLAEYLAPLATLGDIQALLSRNQELDLLGTQTINNMMAANRIDRVVTWQADHVALSESGDIHVNYRLDAPADSVIAKIYDDQGNVVQILSSGAKGTGDHKFDWNGKDVAGERLPAGNYSFEIIATDASGNQWHPGASFKGKVDGVRYFEGQAFLDVDGVLVSLADVREISAD